MADYTSKISDVLGTALAIVDIVTDAAADSARNAGDIMGNEVAIKRLQSERAKLVYQLGEGVAKDKEINHDILEQIEEVEQEIERRKKRREKPLQKEGEK